MGPTNGTAQVTRPLPTEPVRICGTLIDLFDTELTCWLFDQQRRRFLVLSSRAELDPCVFELAWERYTSLEPTGDGRGLVIRPIGNAAHQIYVLAP